MIDLLIGGSPCQGFSFAGKQLNFEDPRSKLFFDFIKAKEELKPKFFLLENVHMKKEYMEIITSYIGVEPICINSHLVSAQNRKRWYWTNIPNVVQPEDKQVKLADILEEIKDDHIGMRVREKSKCVRVGGRCSPFGSKQEWDSPFQRVDKKGNIKRGIDKAACLTGGAHSGGNHSDMDIIHSFNGTRRYSIKECERLQTVPDDYTKGVSNTQRFKMLGNAWTVDVIAHIFSFIPDTHLGVVVSLFDGMSCGQLALNKSNKKYDKYFASEIDESAISVTMNNYPRTIKLGNVTNINWSEFGNKQ